MKVATCARRGVGGGWQVERRDWAVEVEAAPSVQAATHRLAELCARLHDAQAQRDDLGLQQELDDVGVVHLDQRANDAQAGEAQVLKRLVARGGGQEGVEVERDVGAQEEGARLSGRAPPGPPPPAAAGAGGAGGGGGGAGGARGAGGGRARGGAPPGGLGPPRRGGGGPCPRPPPKRPPAPPAPPPAGPRRRH